MALIDKWTTETALRGVIQKRSFQQGGGDLVGLLIRSAGAEPAEHVSDLCVLAPDGRWNWRWNGSEIWLVCGGEGKES
jgi:hypothetical protein